ncbi:Tigger transposable element-derived protein 1-like 159, partial [Homarus americanus]
AQKKLVNSPPLFNASVGWLAAFKKRYKVKFAHHHGESASAAVVAAEKYPPVFQVLVKEDGYCRDQIFNCDITGITKDEKQTRGVKTSKDRITAELSDSDQALPANQEEEEMVDNLIHSTSPPFNLEVLSVCEFGKKYRIKDAADRIVEAWCKINVATVLHSWKPLFANSKGSGAEQTKASRERLSLTAKLMDTVEAARDDDGTTADDIEVLGDLLVEELPQDFEGFDAEVKGGVEEGAGRKQ